MKLFHDAAEAPDDDDYAADQEQEKWVGARTCAKCGGAALPAYIGAYDHELAEPEPFQGVAIVDDDGLSIEDEGTRLCPGCLAAFKVMFAAWLAA